MSRAALLSTCGDPFILLLGIKLWQEHWHDEIDRMYINYNNHCEIPQDVVGECLAELVKDKQIRLIYNPVGSGNGPPQVENLLVAKEDLVLLLEDDFYIYTPGVVDGFFKRIESGECDMLGSRRYTYGEVADAAQKKYGLDYSGYGDRGFGFWPTGFYAKREDLLKTDLDFGSKQYTKGEYFKELDHTFSETCYTDTFTWASLQLQHMGLTCDNIPQYHADPYEIEQKTASEGNWHDGEPTYIHGGSLSAGWNGYLSGKVPDIQSETNKREIETRCAFWQIACDVTDGFDDFRMDYNLGINQLIDRADLDKDRIKAKYNLYLELMEL